MTESTLPTHMMYLKTVCSDIPLPRPRGGQRLQRRPDPHPQRPAGADPRAGCPARGEADGRACRGLRSVEESAPVGDALQEEPPPPGTMVYRYVLQRSALRCGLLFFP